MNADQSPTPDITNDPVVAPEDQPLANNLLGASPSAEQELSAEDDFLSELETEVFELEQVEDLEERQLQAKVAALQSEEQTLRQEIATLQASYRTISQQLVDTQASMAKVVQESLQHLEQRKQTLQIAVEQLERRQERIRAEMRTTFAGTSQELAIRVQGFKDYLTGSLQDLAAAAEQLELVPAKTEPIPVAAPVKPQKPAAEAPDSAMPQFGEQRFQSTTKQIRRLLDEYRSKPDYYGEPWKLRRTFEPVHAERVSQWFFNQGGRGAVRTMGSRLQNILISSAIISVLSEMHGDRLRALVLANMPERLGEWRRGLQDCLGISRADFGPERGVVLFESDNSLAVKAERLVKAGELPLIIVDDSEEAISLSLLQFPLLLAFAPDPQMVRERENDDFF